MVYQYWVVKNEHIFITFGFLAELLNAAGDYYTTLKISDISSSCSSTLFWLQSYSMNFSHCPGHVFYRFQKELFLTSPFFLRPSSPFSRLPCLLLPTGNCRIKGETSLNFLFLHIQICLYWDQFYLLSCSCVLYFSLLSYKGNLQLSLHPLSYICKVFLSLCIPLTVRAGSTYQKANEA